MFSVSMLYLSMHYTVHNISDLLWGVWGIYKDLKFKEVYTHFMYKIYNDIKIVDQ